MPGTAKLRRPGYGEKLGWAWCLVLMLLYVPFTLLIRCRYRHIERLPQQGGVIVVVNHVAHIDPLLISKLVIDGARRPRFLAKESIFEVPVVGWFMRRMGHIPVRRGTADAARSFAVALDTLRRGGMIVLHPEGTVTRDPQGWPMAGKTGAARLWKLSPETPVVPVAQWGVQEQINFYTKTIKLFPRPRHVLSVGEPVDLSAFRDRPADAHTLREITDVIMRRLRADVAELRGIPAPTGELYHWVRSAEPPRGEATARDSG